MTFQSILMFLKQNGIFRELAETNFKSPQENFCEISKAQQKSSFQKNFKLYFVKL